MNIAVGQVYVGHAEAGLQSALRTRRLLQRDKRALSPAGWEYVSNLDAVVLAELLGDFAGAARVHEIISRNALGRPSSVSASPVLGAQAIVRTHDVGGGKRALPAGAQSDADFIAIANQGSDAALPFWSADRMLEDWNAGLTDLLAVDAAAENAGAPRCRFSRGGGRPVACARQSENGRHRRRGRADRDDAGGLLLVHSHAG